MNASEFLPKDTRLKGDLLETSGWDGHPVTILRTAIKSYEASDTRAAERKLQVFFHELGDYALECNSRQLKKLIELFGDETTGWLGRQVRLISTDAGIFNGQPCKTITIKEAATTAPPGMATAPSIAPPPASPTPPPIGLEEHDPFADDDVTQAQLSEIERLCTELRCNAVNVCQREYACNPAQLTSEQASQFILRLKEKTGSAQQTVGAMAR